MKCPKCNKQFITRLTSTSYSRWSGKGWKLINRIIALKHDPHKTYYIKYECENPGCNHKWEIEDKS